MKAFVYDHGKYQVKDMPDPKANAGEVVIALKRAGLNHRDLFIANRLGDGKEALVIGSDGAGIIESVGKNVTNVSVGDEVIINPSLRWRENTVAPPAGFDILGMPDNGTFAEKIVLSAEQVEKKPSYLSWDEAATLGISAMTGYRALFTKGALQAGQTVFIPGAGSGVATYLIAFAKCIGAKVITTSRYKEKQEKAKELGADIVLDSNSNWDKELEKETVDLVIDSVGRATFNKSLALLKKGGLMVVFGSSTEDTVELNLRDFFYAQQQLFGSTMASAEEFHEMLALMEKHRIHPVVDTVFTLDEAENALHYLEQGKQFGKIVLAINDD
ncbi:zinc-binding dehydrogenase [Virgibacillus sp. 179-BFC.A HS]|uniref:Zinc-binding dehydrogenase n=1 Tax=Tigheibacillus jepli TaxID=3035914 RepID=A0ABU5CI73_9BACI|nr:zinc-binding dehydrogenase [Virgibacillus sp. 179-BFC.A HS]MDY0406052.1 zinc-binding dehydrogenase [Virgibacillus sp. 179-BFC.A HS]